MADLSTQGFAVLLQTLNEMDTVDEKEALADRLEEAITQCDDIYYSGSQEPLVPDSVYDTMRGYLKVLRPGSDLFDHVGSSDEAPIDKNIDAFLIKYPMYSIHTIKSMQDTEFQEFKTHLLSEADGGTEIFYSLKENGYGIRSAYEYGHLKHAHTRGRSSAGKDITEKAKVFDREYIPMFAEFPLVEVRGELLVSFADFEKAKKLRPGLKSPLFAVASMVKPSATEEETKLLSYVTYNVYVQGKEFNKLSEKFDFLEAAGFLVPPHFLTTVTKENADEAFKTMLKTMEEAVVGYSFFSDGVVAAINNCHDFSMCGDDGRATYGNIALKMERWKQDTYEAEVDHIAWEPGKSKLTPVAIIEPTMTAVGSTVTRVPLYAPCYILMLEAYPGRVINFKFGSEAGVVPCTPDGRIITDKTIRS